MPPLLIRAGKFAISSDPNDPRNFLLGAIGVRHDNAIVCSRNGAVNFCSFSEYRTIPESHAELRVLNKMKRGGIIYVARVLKKDGSLAMSRPCSSCRMRLRMAKVEKVFYTIDANHYGIWHTVSDTDRIYEV